MVFDDGSKDKTYLLADKLKKEKPLLEVIHKRNSGHGATVQYAYRYALDSGADFIFQTDSDGQTDPAEFEEFWKRRNEYAAIIGNRNHREDGLSRFIVTKTLKLVLRLIFGVSIADANAPYRLMKRETLKKYLPIIPENYNLTNVALSAALVKNNEKIKFISITFKKRKGGKNSINMKSIIEIGIKAIRDFRYINKRMDKNNGK